MATQDLRIITLRLTGQIPGMYVRTSQYWYKSYIYYNVKLLNLLNLLLLISLLQSLKQVLLLGIPEPLKRTLALLEDTDFFYLIKRL